MEAHDHAEHARVELGLSLEALWVAYVALGGAATLPQLGHYLSEGGSFTSVQHDYVAQALNDHYIDLGKHHSVPYSDAFKEIS